MNLLKMMTILAILLLTGCASNSKISPSSSSQKLAENSEQLIVKIGDAPEIPFSREDAFFKLRRDPSDNKIKPSYRWRECVKSFIVCLKWQPKTVYFNDLEWFHAQGMGLMKRPRPKL